MLASRIERLAADDISVIGEDAIILGSGISVDTGV